MAAGGKILLLGAGLVAGPLVKYLAECGYEITLANRTLSKAEKMVEGLGNAAAVGADITDPDQLKKLVPAHDLVVSFVPHIHHLTVAKVCLDHKRHMVTSSYIKPEIKAMNDAVEKAGLTFLNELGLDPGIDHMSAMQVIDRIKAGGGKVVGFSSSTGGLPAPDANDNPWGYKFSWSPRGVVLAGRNNGRFVRDGQLVDIPSEDLFANVWPLSVDGQGDFEVYTNRDCLEYISMYNLDGIKDMFRGTIRNIGWCALWKKIADLGLLSLDEDASLGGGTFKYLLSKLIGKDADRDSLAVFLGLDNSDSIIEKMMWLGLLSDEIIDENVNTPLDAFTQILLEKLEYKPGERDMIVMQHRFTAEYEDRREVLVSSLVDFGIPNGDSSMSRTVGLPSAIGADLVMKGIISRRGVLAPTYKDIYDPVLAKLEGMGVKFVEKIES